MNSFEFFTLAQPAKDGHKARVTNVAGHAWFVLHDCCTLLGLAPGIAVEWLEDDEKCALDQSGGIFGLFISAEGVFRLLMRSDCSIARPFQDWLAREALPKMCEPAESASAYGIRVLNIAGAVGFVEPDLGAALCFTPVSIFQAIEHDEWWNASVHDGIGNSRPVRAISEAGFYRLLMRSSAPGARPFQNWLAREVLPSILTIGRYEPQGATVPLPQYKFTNHVAGCSDERHSAL